ncbi:flavodoxin domain-containing protein [Ihubacter sp. rT4E-8]|uniref:flavodoxin domain-containing protein n=1 Tax=Ihubacter sp. rT4E-8 TaxID=3242369 RepID=UPI00137ADE3B
MKKIAVIYAGKYGTTERYARWIAEETGAEVIPVREVSAEELADRDIIIFGGAIHAGTIMGIGTLKKLYPKIAEKKILTFAVGLSVSDKEIQAECRELNFTKQSSGFKRLLSGGKPTRMTAREEQFSQLPCWFFPGAYNPSSISGVDRKLMAVVRRMIEGKRPDEITSSERQLLEAIDHGVDCTDRGAIQPLVEAI